MLTYFTLLRTKLDFKDLKTAIINFYKDNPSDYHQLSANCNNSI